MEPPKEISEFVHLLGQNPDWQVEVSPGGEKAGNWWVDIQAQAKDSHLTVEWRPQKGFGIYSGENIGYGEAPTEVFRDTRLAAKRVSLWFRQKHLLGIKDVRELLNISQEEQAERLGKNQAAVSKFEKRNSDVLVGTLLAHIEALGGKVDIRVRFPGFDTPLNIGSV
jgi:hypothetical protein